jgi:hypothetical protein
VDVSHGLLFPHRGAPAVDAAYSPSLLASTAVVSQPHPERKTILVEANPLFINDLLAVGQGLQRQYRQGYALDTRNSAITEVRATPDLVVLEVLSHYSTGTIAVPAPGAPVPPGTPVPTTPRTVPDPRSMFMTLHYTHAKLPEQVMTPRMADGRIGHFTTALSDFSDDLARTPRQRSISVSQALSMVLPTSFVFPPSAITAPIKSSFAAANTLETATGSVTDPSITVSLGSESLISFPHEPSGVTIRL